MYKVLYRKYRPTVFADVVGQPQVTVTLKNELMRGRIAHAYLFAGSRGTGKTTCAKILARAVNCLNPQNGDPCGECEVCRGLESGSILDVVEIDAASNNGVDHIRSLIEESNFTPAAAKYRVYIIDEVHMLSVAAFNALLKTLEEPPAHVIFILATTEIHKLLPTILSRCQMFTFKRIAPEAIADRLQEVAEKEGDTLDRDAGLLIARLADGAMRDALSLLDQCLGRDSHVTVETVNQTAGVAARDYLHTLAQSISDQDAPTALRTIDALHKESKDMSRLCEELAEYFRGLMLIKTMRDASNLMTVTEAERQDMTRQALDMSLSAILHGLDTFEETLNRMRYANPRVELEMALVRLCSPELDSTPESLLRRLEALERGMPLRARTQEERPSRPVEVVATAKEEYIPAEPEPITEEASPLTEAPVFEQTPVPVEKPALPVQEKAAAASPAPPKPPEQTIEELSANAQRFREWPEILQVIRESTKSVAMAFSGSTAYISGDYILIDAPEIAIDLLKRPEQRLRIREAISRVTGRSYRLGPYRKPMKREEDPLELLARRAKESGINVDEES